MERNKDDLPAKGTKGSVKIDFKAKRAYHLRDHLTVPFVKLPKVALNGLAVRSFVHVAPGLQALAIT